MKKIITALTIIVILVSSMCMPAFALYGTPGSNKQIDAAIAAINEATKTNYAKNGMKDWEFVELVRKFVPESTGVRVELSLTGHNYRLVEATEAKAGYASADLDFYWNLKDARTETYELLHKERIKFTIEKVVPGAKEEAATGFTDVAKDAYYAEAVDWAVENQITAGTSETTFSPDVTCTRAQIITFLWRYAGSPDQFPSNVFTDVKETDYYYKAAIWASKKDMITGSTFGGDKPCTRSETVKYIWLATGKFNGKAVDKFTDVPADADYKKALNWAVTSGITSGTSETTFSPDATCTRGQIVTFLHRTSKVIKRV